MPSSTSCSNDRLPVGLSPRMWVLAALICTSILATIEISWRSLGYRPTVQDDWDLWCTHRDKIQKADAKTVALLGYSRLHQAFKPDAFNEVSDYKHIQLSLFNSAPLASLVDIADNTEFNGVVVCSIVGYSLMPDYWLPNKYGIPSDLIQYYHTDWNVAHKFDRFWDSFFQKNLASLYPDLALQKAGPDVVKGEYPSQWIWTFDDRSQRVEYDKTDLSEYIDHQHVILKRIIDRAAESASYTDWPKHGKLNELDNYVKKIQARGGKVVFLRINTTGEFTRMIEERFPRKKFWDVFAESTSAETIHYQDVPEIANFECIDGSHFQTDVGIEFTKVLARELRKRGVLR